ncbi:MAG: serine protease [Chitinophagales bacterium]
MKTHQLLRLAGLILFAAFISTSCRSLKYEKLTFTKKHNISSSQAAFSLKPVFDNEKLDEVYQKDIVYTYQKTAAIDLRNEGKKAFEYYAKHNFNKGSQNMGYITYKLNTIKNKNFPAYLTTVWLLYIPHLFGAPMYVTGSEIDMTVQVFDANKKLVANYTVTGKAKAYSGMGQYNFKNMAKAAHVKAVMLAFENAKAKIIEDSDKILKKLQEAGPIKENKKEKVEVIGDKVAEEEEGNNEEWGESKAKSGTGFLIGNDGIVATNYHVIEDADKIELTFPSDTGYVKYNGKVLNVDKTNDIALVKIDDPSFQPLSAVPFTISDEYTVGEKIYTIGYPQPELMGTGYKYSSGEINSLTGKEDDVTLMQVSCPIQPGNSGGPLFNAKGDVIGLTTSTLNPFYVAKFQGTLPQNVNYAVKADYLRILAKEYLKNNKNSVSALNTSDQVKVLANYTCLIRVK